MQLSNRICPCTAPVWSPLSLFPQLHLTFSISWRNPLCCSFSFFFAFTFEKFKSSSCNFMNFFDSNSLSSFCLLYASRDVYFRLFFDLTKLCFSAAFALIHHVFCPSLFLWLTIFFSFVVFSNSLNRVEESIHQARNFKMFAKFPIPQWRRQPFNCLHHLIISSFLPLLILSKNIFSSVLPPTSNIQNRKHRMGKEDVWLKKIGKHERLIPEDDSKTTHKRRRKENYSLRK